MTLAVVLVLIPGAPLVPILFLSQALNAVLLLPLLIFVIGISRDRHLMGNQANGPATTGALVALTVLLAVCLVALAVASLSG